MEIVKNIDICRSCQYYKDEGSDGMVCWMETHPMDRMIATMHLMEDRKFLKLASIFAGQEITDEELKKVDESVFINKGVNVKCPYLLEQVVMENNNMRE